MPRRQEVLRVAPVVRLFADDRAGQCEACGQRIYLRPHVAEAEVTRVICIQCWVPAPGDVMLTTEEDVREMLLYGAAASGPH